MPQKPTPKAKQPSESASRSTLPTEPIETTLVQGDPRDQTALARNARKMSSQQFNRLVDNIKRDGCLTSTPLVYPKDGKLIVLSGNHRVKAAVAAGLQRIQWLQIEGELTEERLIAIQLSHNAITGEDDPNLLRELYEAMPVLEKLYSGLTDADFGDLDSLDLTKLTIGSPRYREVSLMFLEEDHELFLTLMEQLGKRGAKLTRFHARLADFEQFEATLVRVQDGLKIFNQAMSIATMAELALERVAQIEAQQEAAAEGEPESNDA